MSFVKRKIDLTFSLGEGDFGDSGKSTQVKVAGLRTSVSIHNSGAGSMGQADIRVEGLTPTLLNSLSALNVPIGKTTVMAQRNNTVLIEASDEAGTPRAIYQGGIIQGRIDFNNAPDTALTVTALAGIFDALNPVKPSSYPKSADAADIMKYLAGLMGYTFNNYGVKVKLATPYFPGTAREQAIRCANAAGIAWVIDNGSLDIWPLEGSRGDTVLTISPDTGMIGYPTYWTAGISVQTIFNPYLRYGQKVQVQGSSLLVANGIWKAFDVSHELQSETPDGAWFSAFNGSPYV